MGIGGQWRASQREGYADEQIRRNEISKQLRRGNRKGIKENKRGRGGAVGESIEREKEAKEGRRLCIHE